MVRDRQAFRVLHRRYGIEQLIRWYEEDCKSPPQRGRVPFSWFMPLSEPVRAKTITERMTNPPRRKARKI